MRIAIDIRRIEDFGVGTYIRNLVLTLAAKDRKNQYLLLGDPQKAVAVTSGSGDFQALEWGTQKESWWTHMRFHHFLQMHRVELLHVPYLRAVLLSPCPYLMTVHDVADFLYSSQGSMKRSLRWKLLRRSLAAARRVLAVSHATKRDIENLFEIPSSKIAVVENAIDERFLQSSRREERRLVLERYQVNYPFLLYVGSARPQKNIPRLIEAFAVVKGELRNHPVYRHLKLLIIGDELSEHSDLRRTVIRTRTQNEVRFLGFVPVEILRVFYQAAEVFV
ncbi:MAG: glycosyltransferase, partial [Acidobacteria bacterium]|nr:glycosyltransferase [Acidobacteriota bacterium]